MKLYIDNKPYEVSSGKNLLETCLELGFDLPYFCWHPALGSVGACRQCAIKVYKDEEDKKGRLIMSCMEPVANNQRISIQDPEANEFRGHVIEWLMTNHPHDCAVCDEGGSCHLQDMTVMTGHAVRRFQYNKRTHRNQDLGPFINHEMNRCIQCYRCVRFYKDYAGGKDLDAFASRSNVYFGRHTDGPLESEFSGNLTEVCPTGVFTDKTLKQHYTRKWDLTTAPSVCQHCSVGCNVIAGERYGELRSITNRYNGKVNGYFICDRGRFGYEYVNRPDRITRLLHNHEEIDKKRMLSEVSQLITQTKVIGIGSPRASVQSNFALKTLVGSDNFYAGISVADYHLTSLIVKILTEGPARTPSLREVEEADAVFILGEDLTNTAPMFALAVRQSVRQQPLQDLANVNIPIWNDAAARELIQEKKGPLFVATPDTTKLDDIAAGTYHATPDELARLGVAVAHLLDNSLPDAEPVSHEVKELARKIAQSLSVAKRPVVISGASCGTDSVVKAAANIAWALHKKNNKTGLVLTLSECNSMGLGAMGGQVLESAADVVRNGKADTVIILENDLYRRHTASKVSSFLKACQNTVVLDHTETATSQQANYLIPAGAFSESDGIIVSNEGRAQRYFQVFETTGVIQESWRWLLEIGAAAGNGKIGKWENFDDITKAIAEEELLLKSVDQITPPASYRINGQRIPRETHRYSGRTSMLSNVHVSEPKPPTDPDSSLSYTMEGFRGIQPSTMIPFFWSPGWNSVQSTNKYQQEIGGPLIGGDPGIRLFEPHAAQAAEYFKTVPEAFKPKEGQLLMLPLYHIFGSEELSSLAPAVSQRIPKPSITINRETAIELQIKEDEVLSFEINGLPYRLPVKLSNTMPRGAGGLPIGVPGLPFVQLPDWGILNKR